MADLRIFKVKSPHMAGDDIAGWQRTLNTQMDTWQVDYDVEVDGDYGVATRAMTATVLYGLGIEKAKMAEGVTPELRIKVRNKDLTEDERERFHEREPWRLRLRKQHEGGGLASPLAKIISHSWGWHPPAHDGVDLICPEDAPIFAICKASVVRVSASGWWGSNPQPSPGHPVSDGDGIIIIRALQDIGPIKAGLNFGYGHAEDSSVREGQIVEAGQRLGRAGFARAAHVHFMANNDNNDRGVGDRDPWPYVEYAMQHS
jgi:murein DD-endopeptidase MepM/ murein hydrolase activator NlpD